MLGDNTSFFFFIFFFSFLFLLFYVINYFHKNYYIIIILSLFFFYENYFYFFIFRDVPGCSGMFRNVPCSGFYRRPESFAFHGVRRNNIFSLEFCLNEVPNELSVNDQNFANFENI